MIRFTVHKVMDLGMNYVEAFGLSTDEKPTSGICTGSVFVEVDTGRVYLFDEDNSVWHNLGIQGGAGDSVGNSEDDSEDDSEEENGDV